MTSPTTPSSRPRGRPRGRTPHGDETRQHLYATAIRLISERGWQATTLREVAEAAGVSVGLLYRYFPSKRAVVLALYEELSAEYAQRAADVPPGTWRQRFMRALNVSLDVLRPHRATLSALVPVLIGDREEGVFAPRTAFSRLRVQAVFVAAVTEATDRPRGELAVALGRLLYLLHMSVILWWLLDRSPDQRATSAFLVLLRRALQLSAPLLALPPVRQLLLSADLLAREALYGPDPGEPSGMKA